MMNISIVASLMLINQQGLFFFFFPLNGKSNTQHRQEIKTNCTKEEHGNPGEREALIFFSPPLLSTEEDHLIHELLTGLRSMWHSHALLLQQLNFEKKKKSEKT